MPYVSTKQSSRLSIVFGQVRGLHAVLSSSVHLLKVAYKMSVHAITRYLPAGRMEPGEDIAEACQREVLEEAGYECQPTTLLSIESNSSLWFRFNFAAVVTGLS